MTHDESHGGVLHFWRAAGEGKWFNSGDEFDKACRATLDDAHFVAARCELDGWMAESDSALARGFDARVDPALRFFFFHLPFEDSEDIADQQRYAGGGF